MKNQPVKISVLAIYGSRRMMPLSATAMSEALDYAFRAALLLTGSADSAEKAVLNGIAGLESSDDLENGLVSKTVEFVIRQREDFPNPFEHALSLLPDDLHHLSLLLPVRRDCFLLRMIFGITPANCAAILNLTIEQLEESLHAAFEQLSLVPALVCSPGPVHQTKGAQQ